jgi:hypothetical protein
MSEVATRTRLRCTREQARARNRRQKRWNQPLCGADPHRQRRAPELVRRLETPADSLGVQYLANVWVRAPQSSLRCGREGIAEGIGLRNENESAFARVVTYKHIRTHFNTWRIIIGHKKSCEVCANWRKEMQFGGKKMTRGWKQEQEHGCSPLTPSPELLSAKPPAGAAGRGSALRASRLRGVWVRCKFQKGKGLQRLTRGCA